MGLFLIATPALAAQTSPWWHLETSTRPTYIQPGVAVSASSELTVSATIGTYTLTYAPTAAPETTAPLPYNASAATVQAALQNLPAIGAGNVEVSGGPCNAAPCTIAFVGALRDQVISAIAADSSKLHGGAKEAKVTQFAAGQSDGEVYLSATNVGNAALSGEATVVKLKDVLPAGLEAVAIGGSEPEKEGAFNHRRAIPCDLATLTCTFKGSLAPFDALEMRIGVDVEPATPEGVLGEPNEARVSGGNAATATATHPVTVSTEPVPFAPDRYSMSLEEEGGAPATHAAAHPFQFTTQISLNQGRDVEPFLSSKATVLPLGLPKDVHFNLPPGLIGNPSKLTKCTTAQFFTTIEGKENRCPQSSAVGVVNATVYEPATVGFVQVPEPVFNMEPEYGEPARFGFYVVIANSPVFIDTAVRSGIANGVNQDYGITAEVNNVTQTAAFLASTATFWGVPGAPAHEHQRGWGCFYEARNATVNQPCLAAEELHPPVLFTNPARCEAGLATSVDLNSWDQRAFSSYPGAFTPSGLGGCNQVPFSPEIHAEPTSDAATSPTGLNFDINVNDAGLENPGGLVQSQIKRAVVTLPQGFTTNPSVAEGLKACSQAQYEAETVDSEAGANCPNESKVGDVEIESPLIEGHKVLGSIFVARQHANPNDNLLTLYMVAKNPELGVMVRQALKVTPDPVTGQLSTEVDNIPQLPFSRFHLSFRQGQRSPLVTPPTCGTYTVTAALYPYSEPDTPRIDESSFAITQGPEGQGCPSGLPPFHPGLEAGTQNNAAGTYSPFYTHITRKDSEQEITRFSIKLPPGVIGKLAGVLRCSDAGVAAAKARENEGGGTKRNRARAAPRTPKSAIRWSASEWATCLAYAPGKLYLAGPYHGSTLSIVSITAAKVGPFDLGTVVVRFALRHQPGNGRSLRSTGQVQRPDPAHSRRHPSPPEGHPSLRRQAQLHAQPDELRKEVNGLTILGCGLTSPAPADDNPVTVTSPFQAADCASLGFKPKLKLTLKGGTKRGATPAFKAVLTYPKKGAYANIAKSVVTLPHTEFLEQSPHRNGLHKGRSSRKATSQAKNARSGEHLRQGRGDDPAARRTPQRSRLPPLEQPQPARPGCGPPQQPGRLRAGRKNRLGQERADQKHLRNSAGRASHQIRPGNEGRQEGPAREFHQPVQRHQPSHLGIHGSKRKVVQHKSGAPSEVRRKGKKKGQARQKALALGALNPARGPATAGPLLFPAPLALNESSRASAGRRRCPLDPIPSSRYPLQMAKNQIDVLAAPTDAAQAVATPTVIDADEFDRAQRDDRWRDFCLQADRYVAETTRPAVRASQPA